LRLRQDSSLFPVNGKAEHVQGRQLTLLCGVVWLHNVLRLADAFPLPRYALTTCEEKLESLGVPSRTSEVPAFASGVCRPDLSMSDRSRRGLGCRADLPSPVVGMPSSPDFLLKHYTRCLVGPNPPTTVGNKPSPCPAAVCSAPKTKYDTKSFTECSTKILTSAAPSWSSALLLNPWIRRRHTYSNECHKSKGVTHVPPASAGRYRAIGIKGHDYTIHIHFLFSNHSSSPNLWHHY